MRWEEYAVRVMASALVITCLFTLWMIWELADPNLPDLTNSALAQDTTSETTGETTQETTVVQATVAQATTNQQTTVEETTFEETTTPRLSDSGAGDRAVPLMPNKRCPKEFPVKRATACYSR